MATTYRVINNPATGQPKNQKSEDGTNWVDISAGEATGHPATYGLPSIPTAPTSTVAVGGSLSPEQATWYNHLVETQGQPAAEAYRNSLLNGGISLSVPSFNETDRTAIEQQVSQRYQPLITNIEERYAQSIAREKQLGAGQARTLTGQLATERRFSTSAQAYIDWQQNENAKQIADLEKQRDIALNDANYQRMQEIDKQITAARTQQQTDFENTLKIIDAAQKEQDRQTKAQAGLITASREGAVIDLFNQGVQDAATMLNYLNYDQGGNLTGDFTLKEVSDILDKIKTQGGLGEIIMKQPELYSGLSATQKEQTLIGISQKDPNFDFSTLLTPKVDENLVNAVEKNPKLLDELSQDTREAIISKLQKKGITLTVPKEPNQPTESAKLRENIKTMNNSIATVIKTITRGDNYLSPEEWNQALDAWISKGFGTIKEFEDNFSRYQNPNDTYQ